MLFRLELSPGWTRRSLMGAENALEGMKRRREPAHTASAAAWMAMTMHAKLTATARGDSQRGHAVEALGADMVLRRTELGG